MFFFELNPYRVLDKRVLLALVFPAIDLSMIVFEEFPQGINCGFCGIKLNFFIAKKIFFRIKNIYGEKLDGRISVAGFALLPFCDDFSDALFIECFVAW